MLTYKEFENSCGSAVLRYNPDHSRYYVEGEIRGCPFKSFPFITLKVAMENYVQKCLYLERLEDTQCIS